MMLTRASSTTKVEYNAAVTGLTESLGMQSTMMDRDSASKTSAQNKTRRTVVFGTQEMNMLGRVNVTRIREE